ncbi:3-dehydroquinate synthase family protein [Streptomyces zhihengii]|uniref:3-dehydroquinate synthase family protein n=1 Tax=Streptomyces zhihengii TaxID=1818004 RepID=UPI00339F7F7F
MHVIRDNISLDGGVEPVEVDVNRFDTYRAHVVEDGRRAVETLCAEVGDRHVAVVTDQTVDTLSPTRELAKALDERGLIIGWYAIEPGEGSKSLGTASRLIDWLAGIELARRDAVVSIGGGVVMDTVGYVASVFMRGVPYINVPTTLLGQVDAGIGGKVSVDHCTGKNLVGAFWQPRAVVSNMEFLSSLDRRQIRAGMAEVVKKAVIASPCLFEYIECNAAQLLEGVPSAMHPLVRAATRIKSSLIARDPYERDLRRPLNFGHTVGHAVETATGYGPVLHGEAVSFGMAVAVRIALARDLITAADAERIIGLLRALELPVTPAELAVEPDPDRVLACVDTVRRVRDGSLRFVLPLELGATAIVDDVSDGEIRAALTGSPVGRPE